MMELLYVIGVMCGGWYLIIKLSLKAGWKCIDDSDNDCISNDYCNVNCTTGLPMVGGVDVSGRPVGTQII